MNADSEPLSEFGERRAQAIAELRIQDRPEKYRVGDSFRQRAAYRGARVAMYLIYVTPLVLTFGFVVVLWTAGYVPAFWWGVVWALVFIAGLGAFVNLFEYARAEE